MVEWFLIWLGTFHLEMWSNNNRQKRRLFCFCYYSQSDSLLIVQIRFAWSVKLFMVLEILWTKTSRVCLDKPESFKCKLLENMSVFEGPNNDWGVPKDFYIFFWTQHAKSDAKKSKRNCSVRLLHVIMFQNGSIVEK